MVFRSSTQFRAFPSRILFNDFHNSQDMDVVSLKDNEIEKLTPDEATPTSPISNAMLALCAYYKEFLETDFKKVRTPKRRYALRDSKNSRIGVRIERFSQFRALVAGKLEQQTASANISPKRYRADLK